MNEWVRVKENAFKHFPVKPAMESEEYINKSLEMILFFKGMRLNCSVQFANWEWQLLEHNRRTLWENKEAGLPLIENIPAQVPTLVHYAKEGCKLVWFWLADTGHSLLVRYSRQTGIFQHLWCRQHEQEQTAMKVSKLLNDVTRVHAWLLINKWLLVSHLNLGPFSYLGSIWRDWIL